VERMAYIRILNCEVHCAQYFGKQTKIQNWCTVQEHIWYKGVKHSRMCLIVTRCHKVNFKSATLATKLHTCRDETRLDSAEHSVLKPGSWMRVVDFGTSVKESFRQQLLWINCTQVSHYLSSALYTPSKLT